MTSPELCLGLIIVLALPQIFYFYTIDFKLNNFVFSVYMAISGIPEMAIYTENTKEPCAGGVSCRFRFAGLSGK